MKIRKNAIQKNVILKKYYYSSLAVRELLDNMEVFYLDDDLKICYDFSLYAGTFNEVCLRIFLEQGDEIKVELDENGMYTNVLIKSNGNKYYINL